MSENQKPEQFSGEEHFLSNFYRCPVTYNGWTFKTAEAAFQAQKEPTEEHLKALSEKETGNQAKAYGGKKTKKMTPRPDWDDVRVEIMEEIVRAKFTQNPDLAQKLIETGDKELQEYRTFRPDTFWGMGPKGGQNNLGKVLMKIRTELQKKAG